MHPRPHPATRSARRLLSSLASAATLAVLCAAPTLAAKSTHVPGARVGSVAYEPESPAQIKAVLDRVLGYLDTASPVRVVDRSTGRPVDDLDHLPPNVSFAPTDFLLTTYEWGVTYSGMLHVADITGDRRYAGYVDQRLTAIAKVAADVQAHPFDESGMTRTQRWLAMSTVLHPQALDDCGAMAAAMIEASLRGLHPDLLRPRIDTYMAWVRSGQYRLPDGTLARHFPMPDTLWADDLYMSVPALSDMYALTHDRSWLDDAARQIRQFSARMFVSETGLYRHGWVSGMTPHPAFYWARANGWAALAMCRLLDVMPENDPARPAVLAQYRAHIAGLAAVQSGSGLWHQLLNRPDSYLETSASAMFVYAIAHGIDKGWLDPNAYGPVASVGWNAVASQVNERGQVEGTCIGTGMGFDPMFYYRRPTSVFAAHGYGPVLLAGAEMIRFRTHLGARVTTRGGGTQFEPAP